MKKELLNVYVCVTRLPAGWISPDLFECSPLSDLMMLQDFSGWNNVILPLYDWDVGYSIQVLTVIISAGLSSNQSQQFCSMGVMISGARRWYFFGTKVFQRKQILKEAGYVHFNPIQVHNILEV